MKLAEQEIERYDLWRQTMEKKQKKYKSKLLTKEVSKLGLSNAQRNH